MGRCTTGVDAVRSASGGTGLTSEALATPAARTGPTVDAHGVEYEDRVSLSGDVQTRLDVTRGIEETRPDGSGDDQPMRSRMSPEHRERIRELFETDMSVRTELATTPAGAEPLRGLPSFTVELGPDGRAYAVEPGVEFDPPDAGDPEPPPPPVVEQPREEPPPEPVDAAAVEEREPPPPREDEPAHAGKPRDAPERKPADTDEPSSQVAPQRFAEAYRAAAVMRRAPGGFTDPLDDVG